MPEIPKAAIDAVSDAIGLDEFDARDALEAAAPILAEHIAQAILAHAERQHPRDKDHVPTAWDRHFATAARVAAGAFDTREDQLRMTAEAIERGDFIACDIPEVPR